MAGCATTNDGGDDPTCTTELPYTACGDGTAMLWTETANVHRPGAPPVEATVSAIDPLEDAGVSISFDASEGPERLVLPAAPALRVGETVNLVPDDLGWRVESAEGVMLAFAGTGGVGLRPSGWPVDGDLTRVVERVGDVEIGVTPGCAGWAQIAACGVTVPDEGVVYYDLDFDGTPLTGLPQSFELEDGRRVTLQAGSTYQNAFHSRSDCETSTCLISRPVGFGLTMVVAPAERACSGLPPACTSAPVFEVANPDVFGVLTEGPWTVAETITEGSRVRLTLDRDGTSTALDLPADPLFEPGEAVTVLRDASGIAIESADGTSGIYFGPNELPGDTLEIADFVFGTVPSCGGWVEHQTSPDLCPVEAAEALSLTLEGVVVSRPGEINGIGNARTQYTLENRGVFRTVENAEPGDECAGCMDPPWGRSALLVVRAPL